MVSVIRPLVSFFPFLISPILNIYFFHLGWAEYFSIVWWYLLFILFGLGAFGFVSLVFSGISDKAYGVSKTLGFVIVGYLAWIFQVRGLVNSFNLPIIAGLSILLLGGAFSIFKIWGWTKFKELITLNYSHILNVEGIFSFVFFIYLVIKSYSPEIWWGEKPMDFSLLNFLIRNQYMPAVDPWFNGQVMHYYYLGYYYFANIINLTGIPSSTGYLLAISTLPALMASSLYSFFITILKRKYLAIISAMFLVFASNWASFWKVLAQGQKVVFHFFWSTTRVFAQNNFAEYPSWSFLFADLHPHVMSYPITSALLVFLLPFMSKGMITRNWGVREYIIYGLLTALLFGGLIGINGWDLIIWSIVWATILIINFEFPIDWKKFILLPGMIVLASLLLYFPMLLILSSGKKTVVGMVRHSFNSFSNVFMHEGHWFLLILLVSIPLLWRLIKNKGARGKALEPQNYILNIIFFLLPISLIVINPQSATAPIYAFCLLFLLIHLMVKSLSARNTAIMVATSLIAAAVILMLLSEHFIFMDRTNTLFKTFNNVWILLGISFFALSRYLVFFIPKTWGRPVSLRYSVRNLFIVLVGLVALGSLVGTGFNIYALSKIKPQLGNRPMLNGTHYLKKRYPNEFQIIKWINKNVKGTPGIVEWYGRSFDYNSCLISIHTGLPAHLGWPSHLMFRGVSRRDAYIRKLEIDRIYKSSDALKIYELLKKFKIEYIVVGPRERRKYGRKGLLKFKSFSGLFHPVVKAKDITLYAIK